jgi:hypothetical protein
MTIKEASAGGPRDVDASARVVGKRVVMFT